MVVPEQTALDVAVAFENKSLRLLTKTQRFLLVDATSYLSLNAHGSQRIWHILNGATPSTCRHCGGDVRWDREKREYRRFCSISCGNSSKEVLDKRAKTCEAKFGVRNPMQSEDVRRKVEETSLHRFGVRHAFQNPDVRDKFKKGLLDKYGVDNPAKIVSVKEKTAKTNTSRYGVRCTLQDEDVKRKSEETMLRRYGVTKVFDSVQLREKLEATNLDRYGSKSSLGNKRVREKCEETNLSKYGYRNPMQNPDVRSRAIGTSIGRYGVPNPSQSHISHDVLEKIQDKNWLTEQHIIQRKPISTISEELGVSTFPIHQQLATMGIEVQRFDKSWAEREIQSTIAQMYAGKVLTNSRKVIHPLEVDCFLPELQLAFEYNGLHWHSESVIQDRSYHLEKTRKCEKVGVTLVHIFESDWVHKRDIVVARMSSLLDADTKMDACEFRVVRVSERIKTSFLKRNHIHGSCRSSYSIGLAREQKLYAIMTFDEVHDASDSHWTIRRFCERQGVTIIDGAKILLEAFVDRVNPKSVLSQVDRRWGDDNLYSSLGFHLVQETPPGFSYTKGTRMYDRLEFQKRKLSKVLANFDPVMTVYENMRNHGYDRIWDCGHLVYKIRF